MNVARAPRDDLLAQFGEAAPTSLSPWGIRLPPDSRVDDHPTFAGGVVEVQDEGSQLIALACAPYDGERIVDLCAGAGGKSLALAAAAPGAIILATDSNRARLSKLAPRAERAGANIETRLLNPPRELTSWQTGASDRRSGAGRRALLGQRHLAAQSRGPLAADPGAARRPR